MKIVVTGATGQLGRLVVKHLLDRVPASQVVASVRDPDKGGGLGVEVRHGDFDRPETLGTAFAGADKVLIISSQGDTETRVRQHLAAVRAAREAGARHLLYTSMTRAVTNKIALADTHRPTEDAIKATGVPYTFLRNNWYFENDLGTVAAALASGTVSGSTKGGRWAPATRDDYARAAAVTLITGGHENAVYELGSPVSSGYADWAEAISAATGREIGYAEISSEQLAAELAGSGVSGEAVEVIIDAQQAISRSELDVPTGDLTKLLGHEPVALRDWITETVTAQQS
jgi:NAD(P)H dehydrogenase (quinone)